MLRLSKLLLLETPAKALSTESSNPASYIYIHSSCPPSYHDLIERDLILHPNFITVDQEKSLVDEIEPFIGRRRYEFNHWDDAIHGYRETDRFTWNPDNAKVFERIRDTAFPKKADIINKVHILDLAETGWIKPHVDSVRFCGNIIAGLSLLTDSVMRFVMEENKSVVFDVLLQRRSLYVMKDDIRYKFLHEILKNEESFFGGIRVEKGRRISFICRNESCESNT